MQLVALKLQPAVRDLRFSYPDSGCPYASIGSCAVSSCMCCPKEFPHAFQVLNSANNALGTSVNQVGRFSFFKNTTNRGSLCKLFSSRSTLV
jgi:hypothetical protein